MAPTLMRPGNFVVTDVELRAVEAHDEPYVGPTTYAPPLGYTLAIHGEWTPGDEDVPHGFVLMAETGVSPEMVDIWAQLLKMNEQLELVLELVDKEPD